MGGIHRVGVIGLGVIGQRMLTNMPKQGRLAVAGAWDLRAEARAAAAEAFPDVPIAESAEALIGDAGTDCVYIGVPPGAHGVYARAAVAAGKAVFCEKPLGVDLAESRALVALVEAAGRPQAVNLSLAAARGTAAMREALATGALGAVAGADIRLRFAHWPRLWQGQARWLAGRAEGGFTREVATHFLYLAEALFGPGRLVGADARYPAPDGAESHVLARLDFGGVPVTLAGSSGGAGADLIEFTLWGQARSFRLTDFYRLWASDGAGWEPVFPEIAEPPLDAYMRQLDALVRLLDGDAGALPDFRAALRVQELVEAILAGPAEG